jgi:hypothetical protein
VVALILGSSLKAECITSGTSLGKTEASNLVGCELRKVFLLDFFASILAEKCSDKGVLM